MKPGQVKFKHPTLGTTMYGTEQERDRVLGNRPRGVGIADSSESVFPAEEGKVYDQVSGQLVTEAEAEAQAKATAKAVEAATTANREALEAEAEPPKKSTSKKS